MKFRIIFIVFVVLISSNLFAKQKTIKSDNFLIHFDEATEEYTKASLNVLEVVRANAIELGFIFPKKIEFRILKSAHNALYVSKENPNTIIWEYSSLNDFLANEKSGFNNVYGLCHELGHVCMNNINSNRNNWMTSNYREGWANYFGTFMIDKVFAVYGFDLWPDKHDYRIGYEISNFERDLISDSNIKHHDFNVASLFWYKLAQNIGDENISKFFFSIKKVGVKNPNCDELFLSVLQEYKLSPEFIADYELNKSSILHIQK